MELSTFLDHLDGHGGDVAAWPNDTRIGAEALMVHSSPARAALVATLEVERLLREGAARDGAPGLAADVLAARAMRRPQDHAASRSARPATRAMVAAAAMVVLCLGVAPSGLLNVLLIGIIAGHVLTARRDHPPGALVPGAQVRALPAEERRRFAAVMATHREAIHAARLAQRRARLAAKADISAPVLEADKVRADFAVLREANGAVQAAVNDGLVEALGVLSPTSRSALVARKEP